MQIYPAIDIKNGQCVRLQQGKFDNVTVYGKDPVNQAQKWIESGATYIHVVDLDGARQGTSYNDEAIKNICEAVKIPVQTGGGIRNMRDIEHKLSLGVSRVILGTVAIKNPELVKEAVKNYGDKIVVGIDAMNGRVAVEGWEQVSDVSAMDLCLKMKNFGVKTIIYTDISKDGMMVGPNIDTTRELIDATNLDIIASGGVSTLKDLENVSMIGAQGAIIGKALYQGSLSLTDVINKFEK
jgi:phosphoribosylformimino-5-aminoimidazole carboxamide ribotide isomerase